MVSLRRNPAPERKPHRNLRYMDWNFKAIYTTTSENELVKTFLEGATLIGLAASIGWIAKKAVKENFTSHPSSNTMNYVKFTVVMAAAITLTQYLEDQKIIPNGGIVYSMAPAAILAGGAVMSAFAFIDCNYLAPFLSGYDSDFF